MKTNLFALALLCGALYADQPISIPLEKISEPIAPRNIQVLLEKDATGVLLEVKGPYYIFNPHDGSRIASGLLGKRFMIHEMENGLKWGEEFPGIHQIYIKPRSQETSIFINGIQYSGAIAIYGVCGMIHVVGDLDIEDYVKAVLAPQFLSPLEPEVLSALAILARTDAYYRSTRAKDSFWHTIASETGYQGCALVVPNSPIDRAVNATKNLILVHPTNGKNLPFAASWTENCAGKTAPYQTIFRKEGNTPEQGVEAPHAAIVRQDAKWQYSIAKKMLARILDVPSIQSLEVFADKGSGKVYALRVKNEQTSYDFDYFIFQGLVGSTHLQSTDFTVQVKDELVTFTGFGRGHGVGLCLYSAGALAQNGENALKILSKFFPETYLFNLNAMQAMRAK